MESAPKILQERPTWECTLSQVDDGYRQWRQEKMAKVWRHRRNPGTLLAALKACSRTRNLERGKQVHAEAVECGHDCLYVATALIRMYAKCGSMVDAQDVFDGMKHRDVVSWTVLILGYTDNGQNQTALDLFARMRIEGPAPSSVTLVAALKACTSLAVKGGTILWAECKNRGEEIYISAVENGCISDVYVKSALIELYAKCGSMVNAREVFDGMKDADVVSWNVLILGYADNGQGHTALNLFSRMSEGPVPDCITFVAALKACTSLAVKERSQWKECRDKGKQVHNFALENGYKSDIYIQSTLLDMYAKCGCIASAHEVFDDMKHPPVVTWTALILGYVENGEGSTALDIFTRMQVEGPAPDSVTLVAALKACASVAVKGGANRWLECKDMGKEIIKIGLKNGCSSDPNVQNTLIEMYAKCGSMVDAHEVFDSMTHPNVVSWNILILGCVDNGQGHAALNLFTNMKVEGPAANSVTLVAVFKACGIVGALEFGRKIHSEISTRNEIDVVLVNCLVDFYAKCGSLLEARAVFDLHVERRDVITWNALLWAYSNCGDNEAMFGLFEQMQGTFRPDGVTFLCVLTCCSRVGLVGKGKECFDAMSTEYGIIPAVEHYNCMVDIFGRANKLDDAMALLEHMPCSPNEVTWMTILSACRKWKNVDIARLAFQCLWSV